MFHLYGFNEAGAVEELPENRSQRVGDLLVVMSPDPSGLSVLVGHIDEKIQSYIACTEGVSAKTANDYFQLTVEHLSKNKELYDKVINMLKP